jgi:hypothetical protein
MPTALRSSIIVQTPAGLVKRRRGYPDQLVSPAVAFTIGTTEPDAATTGPRASVTRSNYAGSLTNVPAGTVLEGLNVTGGGLKLLNDNVTVRDVDIILPPTTVQTSGIDVAARNSTNILIEHVRVRVADGAQSYLQSAGIRGRGFTARFCDLSGTVDGIFAHGVAGDARRLVTADAVYVHDLHSDPNDPGQVDGSHCDALVIGGHVNFRGRGLRLHGHTTSGFLVLNDVAGGYDFVSLTDSWVYGSPTFGSSINVASPIAVPGLEIWRNRISRDGRTPRLLASTANRVAVAWGMTGPSGNTTGWAAGANRNTFMDDGSTVPVNNG